MQSDVFKTIERNYEYKRNLAQKNANTLKEETYNNFPRLQEIDTLISKCGIEASKATIANLANKDAILSELEEKISKLKREKDEILSSINVSLEPKYECTKCNDSGYETSSNGTKMCNCFRQELINEAYNKSNLYRLQEDNFKNFNFSLFSTEPNTQKYGTNLSPRENMEKIKLLCEKFIENFDNSNQKNLLFTGTPGIGKTFISSCIANELLNKGYTVLYQTAPVLLDCIFEYKYNSKDASKELYDNLFNVNLLIIDDLGTENLTSARFSELFTIINSRLLNPKTKTIISTNLSLENLAKNYDDRILSRLIGNFNICKFFGEDLRLKR